MKVGEATEETADPATAEGSGEEAMGEDLAVEA